MFQGAFLVNRIDRWFWIASAVISGNAFAGDLADVKNPFTVFMQKAEQARRQAVPPPPAGVQDLQWNQLSPPGWNAESTLRRLNVSRYSDNDPRVAGIMEDIRKEWDKAPIVKTPSNVKFRLTGFPLMVTPGSGPVTTAVVAPYNPEGACIHTPYPPSNQMVLVKLDRPIPRNMSQLPIWVIGRISASPTSSSMGKVGYQMLDAKWETYPIQKYPLPGYFWPQ